MIRPGPGDEPAGMQPDTTTHGVDVALDARLRAERAELADTRNWLDQHEAAPATVRDAFGLRHLDQDGLVMVGSAIPFSHFNMVLTLGCPAEVDDRAWAAIERFYGPAEHWVVVNEHSDPALPAALAERGYQTVDTWDRIVLDTPRPDRWRAAATGTEIVHGANAPAWAAFVVGCYGMPPLIADWLLALVDRPGWIHTIRRDGGRPDGQVVMARSAFVDGDWAWLGIDAPIPGVMAPCFADDHAVSAALLLELERRGVEHVVTDIEAPSADRNGPADHSWSDLGFRPAYRRTVHHRPPGGRRPG